MIHVGNVALNQKHIALLGHIDEVGLEILLGQVPYLSTGPVFLKDTTYSELENMLRLESVLRTFHPLEWPLSQQRLKLLKKLYWDMTDLPKARPDEYDVRVWDIYGGVSTGNDPNHVILAMPWLTNAVSANGSEGFLRSLEKGYPFEEAFKEFQKWDKDKHSHYTNQQQQRKLLEKIARSNYERLSDVLCALTRDVQIIATQHKLGFDLGCPNIFIESYDPKKDRYGFVLIDQK